MYCVDFAETALVANFGTLYLHVASGKGSMGGAPNAGPRLGDGPIFKASLSEFDVQDRLGKYHHNLLRRTIMNS